MSQVVSPQCAFSVNSVCSVRDDFGLGLVRDAARFWGGMRMSRTEFTGLTEAQRPAAVRSRRDGHLFCVYREREGCWLHGGRTRRHAIGGGGAGVCVLPHRQRCFSNPGFTPSPAPSC